MNLSHFNGIRIQQQQQMVQNKVMMEAGKVQSNEKNKGRAKGQMIGVGMFFAVLIILLILLYRI